MTKVKTSIFVVSDLHLGGAAGFRMCEEQGRARLAALFRYIAKQAKTTRARIVIAGDIVDFLAEEPYDAFTVDEEVAAEKLERIMNASRDVWKALSEASQAGCAITLMLGNHDIELAMAKPRRVLVERIGGPVDFLCDNEAFTFGELLVEHGNRYDGWNAVDHDGLRQLRSRSSRGEPLDDFATQPGSELVARVMNKYKQKYPWVDLLKPETAGVLPILAALGGSTLKIMADAAKAGAGATWRAAQLGSSGTPRANRFVSEAAVAEVAPADFVVARPIDDLDDVVALFESLPATSASTESRDPRMVGEGATTIDEELLFRGLRLWGEKDSRSFRIDVEKKTYVNAAKAIAKRGKYRVIVFGHTHHAKRIDLGDGATYLNTGTWADLMRIPQAIFEPDEAAARSAFGDFMVQLKTDANSLRRLLPTFARIDFSEAGSLIGAGDVFLFEDGDQAVPITTNEILKRLA